MKIEATITNTLNQHEVIVSTNDAIKHLTVDAKSGGRGSNINGGEFLFLSLATCFCNDVYREAQKRNMEIDRVSVAVSGHFGAEGEAASGISYRVDIKSASASESEINDLINYVDRIAEVHRTLREGTEVRLQSNTPSESRDLL
jgi:uncharacterized OsmC-like protein